MAEPHRDALIEILPTTYVEIDQYSPHC
jgi:hypothetical protein